MLTDIQQSLVTLVRKHLHNVFAYVVLTCAVYTVYSNVYSNTFLFDDNNLIVRNEWIHHWSSLGSQCLNAITAGANVHGTFYRPLQTILYTIVYHVSGLTPIGYHLLNVTLHAINACLVFVLGRKLNFRYWASLLAALVWAVHPIQTEAITYMSGTADPLFGFFCLLGVIAVLPDFTPERMVISFALFLLSLLSKESAIIFPALVMTCMFIQRRNIRFYQRSYIFLYGAGTYIILRTELLGLKFQATTGKPDFYYNSDYATNVVSRLYTALATLPSYIQLLVWPTGLHMERTFQIYTDPMHLQVVLGALIVIASLTWIIKSRNQPNSALAWGILWFACAHSIDTGIFIPMMYPILEHWMYLPSVGLFLGISEHIAQKIETNKFKRYLVVIAVGLTLIAGFCCSALTLRQNTQWADAIAFYKNIFSYEPSTSGAHTNLGTAYLNNGDFESAIQQYRIALNLSDKHIETHINLANALLARHSSAEDLAEAESEAKTALSMSDHFSKSYKKYSLYLLVEIYNQQGALDKAKLYSEQLSAIESSDLLPAK